MNLRAPDGCYLIAAGCVAGVLATHAKVRSEVVPRPALEPAEPTQLKLLSIVRRPSSSPAIKPASRHAWAWQLQRMLAVDIMVCPGCRGSMRLLEIGLYRERGLRSPASWRCSSLLDRRGHKKPRCRLEICSAAKGPRSEDASLRNGPADAWLLESPEHMTDVRDLYQCYAGAIARVAVVTPTGDESVGAAFHVGSGVFITARHVVEGNRILNVGTVVAHWVDDPEGDVVRGNGRRGRYIEPRARQITSGPFMHPDDSVDVAAFVIAELRDAPYIELGGHLDDWIGGDEFVLWEGAVFGFPVVPQARSCNLYAARAEVNTYVDKYVGCTKHPHFVISAMARGGFSGGPFIIAQRDEKESERHAGWCLGVVTESLLMNGMVAETGFLTVLTVEPIFDCLLHHRIIPLEQKADWWEGLWDHLEAERGGSVLDAALQPRTVTSDLEGDIPFDGLEEDISFDGLEDDIPF